MNDLIFSFLHNLANKSSSFDVMVIFFAEYLPYMIIIFTIIFLFFHYEIFQKRYPLKAYIRKIKEIILVFFSGIFAWFLANLIKIIIKVPRPFLSLDDVFPLLDKTDFSFPSGHATFYMALAFSFYFIHKKISYFLFFCALVIGIFRIIAGVHYPLDILAGYFLGILISYLLNKYLLDRNFKNLYKINL